MKSSLQITKCVHNSLICLQKLWWYHYTNSHIFLVSCLELTPWPGNMLAKCILLVITVFWSGVVGCHGHNCTEWCCALIVFVRKWPKNQSYQNGSQGPVIGSIFPRLSLLITDLSLDLQPLSRTAYRMLEKKYL